MTIREKRRPHFHFFGVPVTMYPSALIVSTVFGLISFVLGYCKTASTRDASLLGLASALFVFPAELTHVAGHMVSAKLGDAPMDYVDWKVAAINGYTNNDVTPRQHIMRSIGGPIASTAAALIWWLAWRTLKGTKLGALAQVACLQNLFAGVGALMPLPIIDGGVIVSNLLKMRK